LLFAVHWHCRGFPVHSYLQVETFRVAMLEAVCFTEIRGHGLDIYFWSCDGVLGDPPEWRCCLSRQAVKINYRCYCSLVYKTAWFHRKLPAMRTSTGFTHQGIIEAFYHFFWLRNDLHGHVLASSSVSFPNRAIRPQTCGTCSPAGAGRSGGRIGGPSPGAHCGQKEELGRVRVQGSVLRSEGRQDSRNSINGLGLFP